MATKMLTWKKKQEAQSNERPLLNLLGVVSLACCQILYVDTLNESPDDKCIAMSVADTKSSSIR
jgi:hypothetical protein